MHERPVICASRTGLGSEACSCGACSDFGLEMPTAVVILSGSGLASPCGFYFPWGLPWLMLYRKRDGEGHGSGDMGRGGLRARRRNSNETAGPTVERTSIDNAASGLPVHTARPPFTSWMMSRYTGVRQHGSSGLIGAAMSRIIICTEAVSL